MYYNVGMAGSHYRGPERSQMSDQKGQQNKAKGAPSSAGRHGSKFARSFTETANRQFFGQKLRRVLKHSGEARAREYARAYAKFGLEQVLKKILAERIRKAVVAKKTTVLSERSVVVVPIVELGLGATGRDLAPITFGLGGVFAAAGITVDQFPARRRKARPKKLVAKRVIISPNLGKVEPDASASEAEVFAPFIS